MDKHDTLVLGGGSPESRRIIRTNLEGNYNLLEAGTTRQTMLLLEQNMDCIAGMLLDATVPENIDMDLLLSPVAETLLSRIPVIAITRDDSAEVIDRCFSTGAADVIPLHYDPYAMLRRIETIVQLHLHRQNLEQMVQEQARILRHSNETMIDVLSSIIEYRSVESGQHILRIRHFTRILLEQILQMCPEYGLTEDQISVISSAAVLHDVGKIGIPDAILMKPGPLTEEEWKVMKTHTQIGCRILETLGKTGEQEYLRYAHNICHYHHERWDGRGYPEGLSGDVIPVCAQAVGLADAYDALTSRRVYKDAYDFKTAANMIINGECGIFSPKLLECFKQAISRFEELGRAYADGLSPREEVFETRLPAPTAPGNGVDMNVTNEKFLCLLHYVNGFVLELAVDQGYFHLHYNPYPELAMVSQAGDFQEMERIVLDQIVVPEDRQRMYDLIHQGIGSFLRAGMRRQSFRFRFREKEGGSQSYDVTLLRANINQGSDRSLAVMCRKLPKEEAAQTAASTDREFSAGMAGTTFCCCNDRHLTLVRIASGVHTIAGYSHGELTDIFGGRLMELVHPEDRESLLDSLSRQLETGPRVQAEFRCRLKNGTFVWVMYEGSLELGPDGRECLYSYMTDISDTRRAYEELREKITRYEIVLAQTENVLFDWNMKEDTITFSDTWQTVFGFRPVNGHVRQRLAEGMMIHPDDIPLLYDRVRQLENGSAYEMMELRVVSGRGRYIWCRLRASAIRDEEGKLTRVVGVLINIDAEKQAEQALQDRAERDALTKLLNKDAGRRQAEEYLNQFPEGASCAMLIIDLDNFKQVNDRYGHLFGDSVLTRAAREIRNMFRAQDIVARIGGDEFMVLMRGVSGRSLVENRCQRLLRVFRTAFREMGQLKISCSIGAAVVPDHGRTYVELFRRADQALYRAKDQGRDTYAFGDEEDIQTAVRSLPVTAVSAHIDSDDHPGLADMGIVQYAFQRLYTSRDVEASIQELLELVGRQTNVSRVYVFENSPDNRFCSNTYEWCNEGIPSEKENLQNVSYETDIPEYDRNFNEKGIFYCPDIRTLPQNLYDILAPQGICSILHCAMMEGGVFRGYIGFDDCREYRLWTRDQIDLLTYFAEMLSVFLLKMRSQARVEQRAEDLKHVLDNQNGWVYIVDPQTHQLKYLNRDLQKKMEGREEAALCYRCLKDRETPCVNCPLERLKKSGKDNIAGILRQGQRTLLAEAARTRWDGEPACILSWRDMPEEDL